MSWPATRGLLATDHVILNHGQGTWTTPELAPPLLTTTSGQREDISALDRFNVHRCPTRWVFSGTRLELMTRQTTIRYRSATAATTCALPLRVDCIVKCQYDLAWFYSNFEDEHNQGPPTSLLPPTSREGLSLDSYLEYTHAVKAFCIHKHPCLIRN
ncbi:uncharacterized protein TNCV_2512541 [Trichonephila clavipes]|nr:uncharacterized protein TNCV_2512541 [Trichonephila clavipes]